MKVLHVISGLNIGGAENMLYKLVSRSDFGIEHEVVSLTTSGPVGKRIEDLGITVSCVGFKRRSFNLQGLAALVKIIRTSNPDLVQTWMYHADLFGGIAARLAGKMPVVWGVRSANLSHHRNRLTTLLLARINATLSHWLPATVIFNSAASKYLHLSIGYDPTKAAIIPNGFDTNVFYPNPQARSAVMAELGIPSDACIIGLVGRFDPLKGHEVFMQAISLLAAKDNIHFLLCGEQISWDNLALTVHTRSLDRSRLHLLGARHDMDRITASFDIAISSSHGEAFSNSIGEAMACGVPCIVTDVGDSAFIVSSTGLVVPANDPKALANACLDLIAAGHFQRSVLGKAARQRIETKFSLSFVAKEYANLYYRVLASRQTTSGDQSHDLFEVV